MVLAHHRSMFSECWWVELDPAAVPPITQQTSWEHLRAEEWIGFHIFLSLHTTQNRETVPCFQRLQPLEALPRSLPPPLEPLSLSCVALCTHLSLLCPWWREKAHHHALGSRFLPIEPEAVARLSGSTTHWAESIHSLYSPPFDFRSFPTYMEVERIIQ